MDSHRPENRTPEWGDRGRKRKKKKREQLKAENHIQFRIHLILSFFLWFSAHLLSSDEQPTDIPIGWLPYVVIPNCAIDRNSSTLATASVQLNIELASNDTPIRWIIPDESLPVCYWIQENQNKREKGAQGRRVSAFQPFPLFLFFFSSFSLFF